MSTRERETDLQRMLHLVESAQRAGYSESEIRDMVQDALEADAAREAAA